MIVSRKSSSKQEKVTSLTTLEQKALVTVDTTIKIPSQDKQVVIKKPVSVLTKNKPKNNSVIHIEPKKSQDTPGFQKIENLKSKYDTDDLLLIAQKEISAKNTANALTILNILDANAIKSVRAQVLKSRALEQLDNDDYNSYVLSVNTNEAELLLDKAQIMIDKGNLSSAEILLNKATTAPREIISPEIVSNKVLYYKAISSSKQFDIKPDVVTWREASEAWYIVKREMRNQPSHEYYKKADDEITRISAKYRAIKG